MIGVRLSELEGNWWRCYVIATDELNVRERWMFSLFCQLSFTRGYLPCKYRHQSEQIPRRNCSIVGRDRFHQGQRTCGLSSEKRNINNADQTITTYFVVPNHPICGEKLSWNFFFFPSYRPWKIFTKTFSPPLVLVNHVRRRLSPARL